MKKVTRKTSKKYLLLPVLIVMVLCGLSVTRFIALNRNPSTPTLPPPQWFADWLQNPACPPPCWHGITPGETTITDTVKILGELPWLTITFGPERVINRLVLDWDFTDPSQSGGRAYSDKTRHLTTTIRIVGDLSASLEEVIDSYGDPSHVFVVDCHANRCATELIYLHSGLVIYLGALKPDWRGYMSVLPDTPVKGIGFFPPGQDGFLSAFPEYEIRFPWLKVPWEGYSKYRYNGY